jgi:hypothetical protein
MHSAPETFQLKMHLLDISPMIWRGVLVSSSITLRELQGILQVAMGWDGMHLFQFGIRAVDYGSWEGIVKFTGVFLNRTKPYDKSQTIRGL